MMATVSATQLQASSTHEVDLSTDSGVVAQALIPASLWQSSAALIQGYAQGKGLTVDDYNVNVGQSLTGFNQNLQTLQDVEVWIDNVAAQEGTTASAAGPAATSGFSETTVVLGICAALGVGLGLLVWLRS